jgi:dihydroflavonol-4-reductase
LTTVLITGATGQVGNAIARRLVGDGVEPRALVRSPERAAALPAGAQPVFGDVTDAPSLRAALDGCATVYHAAGIPEQWRKDSDEFARVNVEGTRNVVEAALAAGVERFVYTSTDDVLVQAPGASFDESVINPNPGQTPYQRSKQEADRVVTAALDRGLPAVFLHPAGLYGPAPFLVKGLNDLLLELAKRKTPMLLPGGMGVAYSEDVADGHLRAAAQAPVGARYILAESFQSLTDIARAVAANEPRAKVPRVMPLAIARGVSMAGEQLARVTGRPPLISRSVLLFLERGARPSGERARAELGWTPTPFATGVERTLAHFRENGWI